jgi:hypothetical protein
MKKIFSIGVFLSLLFFMPACGGKSGPTTPTNPTVQSITVTSTSSMLYIGATETFTATATMSDSTIKAITSGTWSSDNPNVATVNSSGLVTIVGSGTTNIVMTYSGKSGSKSIRGLPNYQGTWTGTYRVDSCTCTGDWALQNFCSYLPNGTVLNTNLILTQTQDSVSGTFFLGTLSTTGTGPVATNGQLTLTGKITQTTASIDAIFTLQLTTPGQITGTLFQLWTDTTMSGNAQVSCTIVSLSQTSPVPNEAAFARSPVEVLTIQDMIRALLRR